MGKFDGILICTDLDGTLFRNDKTISRENTEAIEYFKKQGGFFTFVTGRMPMFVSYVAETVKPNVPFGCVNGAALYDYEKGEYISKILMNRKVMELVKYVDDNFPDVGIQVNTFSNVYFSKENESMAKFRELTGAENIVCRYDDVEEPLAKIVFGCEREDEIKKLEEMLKAHPMADEFDFIRSEKTLFEILTKGTGKGASINGLCKHLNLDRKKTIAIGDYNNDVEMLEAAGVGIAVSNACAEARAAADFVTVSNEENAIAKVILDIEAGVYTI